MPSPRSTLCLLSRDALAELLPASLLTLALDRKRLMAVVRSLIIPSNRESSEASLCLVRLSLPSIPYTTVQLGTTVPGDKLTPAQILECALMTQPGCMVTPDSRIA